jgi:hypothetical protein
MGHWSAIAIFFAGYAILTGCATITKGTTQIVAVNTPGVQGAVCTLTSPTIGTQTVITPGTLTLQKGGSNIGVHCTKECYIDGIGTIPSNLEGMAAGNIILGGIIGIGVDAASGAMNNYAPDIQVGMTPDPACRTPPPPPPKRR